MTTNAMKKQRSVYSLLMFLMAPPRSLRSRGLNLSNCFQCRVCARRVAALWCASHCFQVSEKAFLFEQTGAGLLCGGFADVALVFCQHNHILVLQVWNETHLQQREASLSWEVILLSHSSQRTEQAVQQSEENTNTFLKLVSPPSTSCVNWVSHFFVSQWPTTPSDMYKTPFIFLWIKFRFTLTFSADDPGIIWSIITILEAVPRSSVFPTLWLVNLMTEFFINVVYCWE